MKHCPHCGAQSQNGKFCANCGGTLAPASKGPGVALWIGIGAAVLLLGVGGYVLLGADRPSGGSAPQQAAPAGGKPNNGQQTAQQPSQQNSQGNQTSKLPSDPKNPFVGGYVNLRVPGAAYTATEAGKTKLYVSSGVMTTGSLLILADGTYAWNSSYDGKLIKGNWAAAGENIVLKKAQEGKDWTVMIGNAQSGGDIVIWDGATWYLADRAKQ